MPDVLDQELNPFVLLKLGKKEFRLAFPMKAVILFHQKTGRNIFVKAGWEKLTLAENPQDIVTWFWCALQAHHPEIDEDTAALLANPGNVGEIRKKLDEAVSLYFPKPEPSEAGETPAVAKK